MMALTRLTPGIARVALFSHPLSSLASLFPSLEYQLPAWVAFLIPVECIIIGMEREGGKRGNRVQSVPSRGIRAADREHRIVRENGILLQRLAKISLRSNESRLD
jgi:hypothetical protein